MRFADEPADCPLAGARGESGDEGFRPISGPMAGFPGSDDVADDIDRG
jgi:hypothetical protein